jgi:hypothetical protein
MYSPAKVKYRAAIKTDIQLVPLFDSEVLVQAVSKQKDLILAASCAFHRCYHQKAY